MIWWVIFGAIGLYLAVILYREVMTYTRCLKYKKQGFLQFHFPLIGTSKLFLAPKLENNQMQTLYNACRETRQKGYPGFTANSNLTWKSQVTLLDIGLIREFFTKETDVTMRISPTDPKLNIGVILEGGQVGLTHRRIFNDFFKIENLNRMTPEVHKTVHKVFSSFKEVDSDGSLRIKSSQEIIETVIIEIVNTLLFGYGGEIPKAKNGKSFCEEMVYILKTVFSPKAAFHPLSIVLFGLPHKFNWLPNSREMTQRSQEMKELLKSHIQKREACYDPQAKKLNIIDMMIEYNKTASSDQLTYDDMIGNCNLFLIAGFDTTSTATNSMIFNLAHHKDIQQSTRSELAKLGIQNYSETNPVFLQSLDQSETLEKVIRESIRINPPAGFLLPKLILKDFTLGDYKFYKGDLIQIPTSALMWDVDHFKTFRKFDIGALTEENKKYYMPFSIGKRSCIGQFLSQMEMKVICQYILERFDIEPVSKEDQVKYYVGFTMGVHDVEVKFVPRKA